MRHWVTVCLAAHQARAQAQTSPWLQSSAFCTNTPQLWGKSPFGSSALGRTAQLGVIGGGRWWERGARIDSLNPLHYGAPVPEFTPHTKAGLERKPFFSSMSLHTMEYSALLPATSLHPTPCSKTDRKDDSVTHPKEMIQGLPAALGFFWLWLNLL